jgi:hypothetical protein
MAEITANTNTILVADMKNSKICLCVILDIQVSHTECVVI